MDINLSQKQSDAWHYLEDNITTEVVYGGAAGGGKSFFGTVWHVSRRMRYPESRGMIGRKSLTSLKQSTLVTLFKVANLLGAKYKYYENKSLIEWANGSVTILKDLDYEPSDPQFERIGSTEFTDIFIDEAGEITEKAFEIANTRIRWMLHDYNLKPKILLTCNPNYNWIRDKYIKDKVGNPIQLKVYQKYIQALAQDNPDDGFKKIYIEQLSKLNSDYDKQRLLYGDWDAMPKTGGEFYKKFDHQRHVKHVEYKPELPLHISFDWNLRPYCTLTIWQIQGKKAFQIDEICTPSPENSSIGICRAFKRKYYKHKAGLFYYGDPNGRQGSTQTERGYSNYDIVNQQLADYNPINRVALKAPPVVPRGNFINSIFENNFEAIEIVINETCYNTISDYSSVKEDHEGNKDKRKIKDPDNPVPYEKYGHCSDANDYLLCTIFADEFNKSMTGDRKLEYVVVDRERKNW